MQIKFAVMRDVYMCSQISINIFLSFQYWFTNRTVLQNSMIYLKSHTSKTNKETASS